MGHLRHPIRVLVVDDSAVFRRFLSRALATDPGIAVIGEVASAEEARAFLRRHRPDVITLDLEMPGQGGLSFLKDTVARLCIPTVVISGRTRRGARDTIEALEAGAVDVLAKPSGLTPGTPDHVALKDFARRIKVVAHARMLRPCPCQGRTGATGPAAARGYPSDWVIALGASTGGVHALGVVLQALPPGCPPVVIVQHMPEGFTGAFARRLDTQCAIEVREAADGDRLRPGQALIAPGGKHHMLLVRGADGAHEVRLVPGDPVCFSRPAVDVLFLSAAKTAAPRLSAAVLTGMGNDGAKGLLALRRAGAQTLCQDEATSQIYGMPARAWELGGAMAQVPLDQVAARLLATVGTPSATAGGVMPALSPLSDQKGIRQ